MRRLYFRDAAAVNDSGDFETTVFYNLDGSLHDRSLKTMLTGIPRGVHLAVHTVDEDVNLASLKLMLRWTIHGTIRRLKHRFSWIQTL